MRWVFEMLVEYLLQTQNVHYWLIATVKKPVQAIFESNNMSATKMWHNELAIRSINPK